MTDEMRQEILNEGLDPEAVSQSSRKLKQSIDAIARELMLNTNTTMHLLLTDTEYARFDASSPEAKAIGADLAEKFLQGIREVAEKHRPQDPEIIYTMLCAPFAVSFLMHYLTEPLKEMY